MQLLGARVDGLITQGVLNGKKVENPCSRVQDVGGLQDSMWVVLVHSAVTEKYRIAW